MERTTALAARQLAQMAGSAPAQADLVTGLLPGMRRWFERLVGGMADESLRLVMVQLIRALADGEHVAGRSRDVWLWSEARSVWCDRTARWSIAPRAPTCVPEEEPERSMARLRAAIHEDDYATFLLQRESGLTDEAVGEVLCAPPATIKERVARAAAALAGIQAGSPPGPDPFAPPPVLTGPLRTLAEQLDGVLHAAEALGRAGAEAWAPGVGVRLGEHELVESIGHGAQGEVWLARAGGEQRAVKLLSRAAASDPRQVQRFTREARLLSSLDHPGLVRVREVGLAPDLRPFFAMDLVREPRPLWLVLRQGTPREAALDLIEQAADALAAVHAAGLVHRDVKPGNVLIGADGRARLVDFGLARRADAPSAEGEESPGTPGYMAPEHLAGDPEKTGSWSDVFSLGAILHLTLTGHPPPTGPDGVPRPALGPDVPPALAELVTRAMALEPGERPRDGRAFLRALRRARRGPLLWSRHVVFTGGLVAVGGALLILGMGILLALLVSEPPGAGSTQAGSSISTQGSR